MMRVHEQKSGPNMFGATNQHPQTLIILPSSHSPSGIVPEAFVMLFLCVSAGCFSCWKMWGLSACCGPETSVNYAKKTSDATEFRRHTQTLPRNHWGFWSSAWKTSTHLCVLVYCSVLAAFDHEVSARQAERTGVTTVFVAQRDIVSLTDEQSWTTVKGVYCIRHRFVPGRRGQRRNTKNTSILPKEERDNLHTWINEEYEKSEADKK